MGKKSFDGRLLHGPTFWFFAIPKASDKKEVAKENPKRTTSATLSKLIRCSIPALRKTAAWMKVLGADSQKTLYCAMFRSLPIIYVADFLAYILRSVFHHSSYKSGKALSDILSAIAGKY